LRSGSRSGLGLSQGLGLELGGEGWNFG
jgi:hypothetical protein